MTPTLGVIIFARMGSQRFPGKMLEPLGRFTLLEWMIRRAQCVGAPVFVATSNERTDDILAAHANGLGTPVHRGPENDVLARAIGCAEANNLDAFARLCGDRPFFDIDEMCDALEIMRECLDGPDPIDLVTNNANGQAPIGLTTEVVRTTALRRAASETIDPRHREHVTRYLYEGRAAFHVLELPDRHAPLRGMRFAVDTREDLENLQQFVAGHDSPDLRASGLLRVVAHAP
jgi:spore coat polysaccharide biosynthesis protein SpsF (cytidylyltransferase family)